MSRRVRLEPWQMALGLHVGAMRHVHSTREENYDPRRKQSINRDAKTIWESDAIGPLGEIAAAIVLGRWIIGGVNTFDTVGDLSGGIEVRTRTKPELHELYVRPHENEERAYVLVFAVDKVGWVYDVVGYKMGAEAKRPEWLENYGGHGPAYFVPNVELEPIENLIAPSVAGLALEVGANAQ